MENPEVRLIQRYFRKTAAQPEGGISHHGDCDFSNIKVCTCGFLSDLLPLDFIKRSEMYPAFDRERADYETVREALMHPRRRAAPRRKARARRNAS